MVASLGASHGNPASFHGYGETARQAIRRARRSVAGLVGATPTDVIFTAGATEAINLALRGLCADGLKRVVTSQTEHKAILETCHALEVDGHEVVYLAPAPEGTIELELLEAEVRADTDLVAIMWANNETGVLAPIGEIGAICRDAGALLLSDGTQAVGKVPVDVEASAVDLLALSGHKMHGPPGIGALVANRRARRAIRAQTTGGGHERGLRAGSLNTPGIVGLGVAADILIQDGEAAAEHLRELRDRLEAELRSRVATMRVNGLGAPRAPHCLNVSFPGVDGEALVAQLRRDVAASTGSACNSAHPVPSHVLKAMGYTDEAAYSAVRFSVSRMNSRDEMRRAAELVAAAVGRVLALMEDGDG